MIKEKYGRTELEIFKFQTGDAITTSGYEGWNPHDQSSSIEEEYEGWNPHP